jgi:hypothetical protein
MNHNLMILLIVVAGALAVFLILRAFVKHAVTKKYQEDAFRRLDAPASSYQGAADRTVYVDRPSRDSGMSFWETMFLINIMENNNRSDYADDAGHHHHHHSAPSSDDDSSYTAPASSWDSSPSAPSWDSSPSSDSGSSFDSGSSDCGSSDSGSSSSDC